MKKLTLLLDCFGNQVTTKSRAVEFLITQEIYQYGKDTFFLDLANINAAARNYVGEGRNLVDSYTYVPIDPRAEICLGLVVTSSD